MKSRLVRRTEKQAKNQLFLTIAGIIALIFVLYQFGPFLLTNTGILIDTLFGKNKGDINYLKNAPFQTPILNPLPQATPSSQLVISGKTIYDKGQVEIYIDNELVTEVDVKSNGEFEEEVRLSEGNNSLKLRYVNGEKQSGFTDVVNISYITDAPSLEIETPQDGTSFPKGDQNIAVIGKTDPDATVSINGRVAIVSNDGKFTYDLGLSEGENKINIDASNLAGKKTTKTITVFYKP